MTTTTTQRQCKGTNKKTGGRCRNQVSGKFKYCPKHRNKKTGGKVNMTDRSKVVPTPKLKPYQVIVPSDATGKDSGWHLMEDQIPQLIANRLKGYKMPSFVKVTLGQGQFVFRKMDSSQREGKYEFRHDKGKRPKEFDTHTEVVQNSTPFAGGGYVDLEFTKGNADRLGFDSSFYSHGVRNDNQPTFPFYFGLDDVHIFLTNERVAHLHVLSLQRTVEMCRKRAEDSAFEDVAFMEGLLSRNEVGSFTDAYKVYSQSKRARVGNRGQQ